MSDQQPDGLSDDELLDLVAATYERHDPVPPSAQRFALEAHRLVSFDAELAEIVSDSLVDAGADRSSATVRTIEFTFSSGSIRIECGSELVGLVQPASDDLRLRLDMSSGEPVEVAVSEGGFFTSPAPSGPFRFVLTVGSDVVRTEWLQA
ncbi:MAG: hypothetical protein AAF962_08940 [Actinomycetota bacterium]